MREREGGRERGREGERGGRERGRETLISYKRNYKTEIGSGWFVYGER